MHPSARPLSMSYILGEPVVSEEQYTHVGEGPAGCMIISKALSSFNGSGYYVDIICKQSMEWSALRLFFLHKFGSRAT